VTVAIRCRIGWPVARRCQQFVRISLNGGAESHDEPAGRSIGVPCDVEPERKANDRKFSEESTTRIIPRTVRRGIATTIADTLCSFASAGESRDVLQ
jgi:hypothetical protein